MKPAMLRSDKVVTIGPDDGILQAKARMTSYGIRHLPVVDGSNRLVGILSDRDLRSVLPYGMRQADDVEHLGRELSTVKVSEVMTRDPHTISEAFTLQDALLQFQRFNVGAFPVVDEQQKVVGIVSYRDMLRMFINFLGVEQPGVFLAVTTGSDPVLVQKLIERICAEKIPIASMLVIRSWEQDQTAIYMYLLTKNLVRIRKMVEEMGDYTLLNPLKWFLRQFDGEPSDVETRT
ncbi:MAG: CBS domain-containing protein [Desulfobacterales bacterium]|nr:CBS domain-containing protein [Desulfobacterales bacterium]